MLESLTGFGIQAERTMDCRDLFRDRKLMVICTAISVGLWFLEVFAMLAPWFFNSRQVTVTVNGEVIAGPVIQVTVYLLSQVDCYPDSVNGLAAGCYRNTLASLVPDTFLQNSLYTAGSAAFGLMVFAIGAGIFASFLSTAALLGQTPKLWGCFASKKAMVFGQAFHCLLLLVVFASYAGIINQNVITGAAFDFSFGGGFGLIILAWLISLFLVVILAWKGQPANALMYLHPDDLKDLAPAEVKVVVEQPSIKIQSRDSRAIPAGASHGAAESKAAAPADNSWPLPPDWRQAVDPATGDSYYWHIRTMQTSWERPRA